MNDVLFEKVHFAYRDAPVLSNVSFAVPRGECLVMIGPNGGGKSTVVRLMLGLLEPQQGQIQVLGDTPRRASLRIGYVPQDVNGNREFPISVEDIVLMGCLGPGRNTPLEKRKAAQQALERVGMGNFRHSRMAELSQGQRQRVLIARALVSSPEMLVLDEPTASVDAAMQEILFGILRDLKREMTVILVSHDLSAIASCATAVACVRGNVHYHGRGEILPEMLESAYGACPVELVAHGVPHRVLARHEENGAPHV